MKYKFLENIATADVAFEAYGKDEEELFENCALALEEVMVDTKTISKFPAKGEIRQRRQELRIKRQNLQDLLYDFLSELVYLKDAQNLIFSEFKIKIKKNKEYELKAEFFGEKIDPSKHSLRADVKAVTMYQFGIQKTKEGFKARVILDI